MTDATRLAEIEAVLMQAKAVGIEPAGGLELCAIARRQMERAERAEANLDRIEKERNFAQMVADRRLEERDAARAENTKLSEANGVLMGEINRLSVELENAQENYRIVNRRWLEADKSDLEARAEAEKYRGSWLKTAEAYNAVCIEADALKALLGEASDTFKFGWYWDWLRRVKVALAGTAKAEEARREGTPAVRPAPAAARPAEGTCLECGNDLCEPSSIDDCWDWDKHQPAPAPPECPGMREFTVTHGKNAMRFTAQTAEFVSPFHCPACPSRRG